MKSMTLVYKNAISILMLFALVTSVQAASDVSRTVHNLSSADTSEYASSESQVCIFCHTPHGGSLDGPLWNRNFAGGTFTHYTTSSTAALASVNRGVNAESMLCLACHDGSVSVYEMINYSSAGMPDNLGLPGWTDVTIVNLGTSNSNLGGGSSGSFGGDLSDDHPISFSYNDVVTAYGANPGLHPDPLVLGPNIRLFSPGAAAGSNRVECSTCHNPHEADLPSFLVMSNSGSALCLACHDK